MQEAILVCPVYYVNMARIQIVVPEGTRVLVNPATGHILLGQDSLKLSRSDWMFLH